MTIAVQNLLDIVADVAVIGTAILAVYAMIEAKDLIIGMFQDIFYGASDESNWNPPSNH